MSQLETQSQLIVKDLYRQIKNIKSVGDSPTEIHLGPKAKKAIFAYFRSIYGSAPNGLEDQQQFYLGILIRMSEKGLSEWTAHVSSRLGCGTVCRARMEP